MASDTTGRDSDKFMLRLPDGMRDRLKTAAEASKRSMNAEIVSRLETSFDADTDKSGPSKSEETLRTFLRVVEDIYDAALAEVLSRTPRKVFDEMEKEFYPSDEPDPQRDAIYRVLMRGYEASLRVRPKRAEGADK